MYRPNTMYRTDLLDQLQALHLAVFFTPSSDAQFQKGHIMALLSVAESAGIRAEFWLFLRTVHRSDGFLELVSERGKDDKMS